MSGYQWHICDASTPVLDHDRLLHVPYAEAVDGYRHAYRVGLPTGRTEVRYARTPNHPADSACPACAHIREGGQP